MFRPEEMCELSLLVKDQDIAAVTNVIARQGVLHLLDTSYLSREEEWAAEPWQERIREYQGIEQRILLMLSALEIPEATSAPEQSLDLGTDQAELQDKIMTVERDVMPLVNTMQEQQQRLTELDALGRRLEPIRDLDIDLGTLRNLTFLHVQIGIVPSANLERLNASLLHVPHNIVPLDRGEAGTLVALFGAAKDGEVLERAARSAYLSPVSLPEEYQGTPKEILGRLGEEITSLKEGKAKLDQRIVALREQWGPTLQMLLWRVRADQVLWKTIHRFGHVRDVYLVAGWIPNQKVSSLVEEVRRITDGRVTADITAAEQAGDARAIPITLHNRGFFRAFEGLVTTYAWPSYDEIDPTPLLALTFTLMFGLMFGDVGHGLVLALAGFLSLSGWVPSLRRFAGAAPVILASGLCATFFGFLYGSIFGLENLLPALWLRPLESITSILLSAVIFGALASLIGFVANMINGWLVHDWRRLLFDRYGLAGMWFYVAVIGVILASLRGISLPKPLVFGLIVVPVLLIVLGEPLGNLLGRHRPLIHDSIGLFLIQSLFEFLEAVISYLSNSLSYVRLGAFAVAHGGLSAIVFILADMAGGPSAILYWIIVAIGNVLIIGFEGLIVGIQTMRLQYYEFFSKFFSGGGSPYRPLKLSGEKT